MDRDAAFIKLFGERWTQEEICTNRHLHIREHVLIGWIGYEASKEYVPLVTDLPDYHRTDIGFLAAEARDMIATGKMYLYGTHIRPNSVEPTVKHPVVFYSTPIEEIASKHRYISACIQWISNEPEDEPVGWMSYIAIDGSKDSDHPSYEFGVGEIDDHFTKFFFGTFHIDN